MEGLVAENLKGEIEDVEQGEEEEEELDDDDDDEFGILMHGIEDATDIFLSFWVFFPSLSSFSLSICLVLASLDNAEKLRKMKGIYGYHVAKFT